MVGGYVCVTGIKNQTYNMRRDKNEKNDSSYFGSISTVPFGP